MRLLASRTMIEVDDQNFAQVFQQFLGGFQNRE